MYSEYKSLSDPWLRSAFPHLLSVLRWFSKRRRFFNILMKSNLSICSFMDHCLLRNLCLAQHRPGFLFLANSMALGFMIKTRAHFESTFLICLVKVPASRIETMTLSLRNCGVLHRRVGLFWIWFYSNGVSFFKASSSLCRWWSFYKRS